jgi:hypothetical protein
MPCLAWLGLAGGLGPVEMEVAKFMPYCPPVRSTVPVPSTRKTKKYTSEKKILSVPMFLLDRKLVGVH